ncbi:hypothetical protein SEA_SPIKELEE_47 [Mycobacterium phage Spikelee]|uniref:Uncharacterized protein n=1 Tax=Mycobacterium phage Spikelee TaxID=2301571 RepID=A0A385DRW6_9CAUD|nr:hypothetical protein I5H90_gp047 [Mycobacterium phage Spikelee]AXQ62176.1 hypothetical protein SEA_SPIKELEE_47 [Mycobacterium phage Spikelee]
MVDKWRAVAAQRRAEVLAVVARADRQHAWVASQRVNRGI